MKPLKEKLLLMHAGMSSKERQVDDADSEFVNRQVPDQNF